MLFKDNNDLKRVMARINSKYSDSQILTYVEQAELKYIIPAIGTALYNQINTAYAAVANIDLLSSTNKKLLAAIQLPLAYYAILDALPIMNVNIGQSGIHETNTANTLQARQWVYQKFEDTISSNADIFMDKLLEFLENNADDYTAWKTSPEYTISKELFIFGTSEFQKYINIFNSRRAFVSFRPFLIEAQEEHLKLLISDAYYQVLKTNFAQEILTTEDKAILFIAKQAIAYYGYANGLLQLCVQLSGTGLKILNQNDSIIQRLAASNDQLSSLSSRYRKMSEQKFAELKKYIDQNVELYPVYKASDAYKAPQEDRNYELPDNSNSKNFSV